MYVLHSRYKPITFLNTYWNLVRDYRPINTTTETLDLTVTFQPLSLFKWQLYAAQAMKSRYECHLDFQEEQEEVDMQLFDEAKWAGLAENECPAFELVQEWGKWRGRELGLVYCVAFLMCLHSGFVRFLFQGKIEGILAFYVLWVNGLLPSVLRNRTHFFYFFPKNETLEIQD